MVMKRKAEEELTNATVKRFVLDNEDEYDSEDEDLNEEDIQQFKNDLDQNLAEFAEDIYDICGEDSLETLKKELDKNYVKEYLKKNFLGENHETSTPLEEILVHLCRDALPEKANVVLEEDEAETSAQMLAEAFRETMLALLPSIEKELDLVEIAEERARELE
jgi:hypothetical protein